MIAPETALPTKQSMEETKTHEKSNQLKCRDIESKSFDTKPIEKRTEPEYTAKREENEEVTTTIPRDDLVTEEGQRRHCVTRSMDATKLPGSRFTNDVSARKEEK